MLHEWVGKVALGMGFLGLSLFFVGLGWAMWELSLSLTPVEEEGKYYKPSRLTIWPSRKAGRP